ncbi:hypothetical protein BD410DRAFT_616743 [Rickenella mellea]|uniref:Uncharacterized protein n=1 Tax=Rickenella mellea TaxID=50990 RepID=A0A4Y7PMI3_9AGAM|nr:hypothetical protein BD410DRAFT_616743 [Rickenella mellea]
MLYLNQGRSTLRSNHGSSLLAPHRGDYLLRLWFQLGHLLETHFLVQKIMLIERMSAVPLGRIRIVAPPIVPGRSSVGKSALTRPANVRCSIAISRLDGDTVRPGRMKAGKCLRVLLEPHPDRSRLCCRPDELENYFSRVLSWIGRSSWIHASYYQIPPRFAWFRGDVTSPLRRPAESF